MDMELVLRVEKKEGESREKNGGSSGSGGAKEKRAVELPRARFKKGVAHTPSLAAFLGAHLASASPGGPEIMTIAPTTRLLSSIEAGWRPAPAAALWRAGSGE